MSDDIVIRLRAEGEMEPVGDGTKVWWSSEICQEAADEIERLRALIHRWETCDEVVNSLCGWDSEKTLCQWCEANGVSLTND